MKKRLLLALLLLALSISAFAQDIVYTVSGKYNQQPVALDSILVENLSNQTSLLFRNLATADHYEINLTLQTVENVTGIQTTVQKTPEFFVTQNMPGLMKLTHQGNRMLDVQVSVVNLKGQKIFLSANERVSPDETLAIQLGQAGVYLVKVETAHGVQTFKANGVQAGQPIKVSTGNDGKQPFILKNSDNSGSGDFSFVSGDELRVSVYKSGYYARPKTLLASASEQIDYTFEESTVGTTGVSDVYVELNHEEISTEYEEASGKVVMSYTGDKPTLNPGDIITVDADTTGYLRKIKETIEQDGSITVETEQAYFDDVFVDMEIKLHTEMIEPLSELKSTSTPDEITRALTDEKGYIHPVEIIYHYDDGTLKSKNVFSVQKADDARVQIIDFYTDLATDLYGKEGDNVHLYIDRGHVSMAADAVFEFSLSHEGEITEDTKVKKGDLKDFKFYLESRAEFHTHLALDMKQAYEESGKKEIYNMRKRTAKFIVAGVPVWITFNCDLYGAYNLSADASLSTTWGFESNHTLQAGGHYNRETDSFSPISDYEPENKVFPLNIEGEINAHARMEVYPRVEIMFYSFFGPYAELAPYVEGNYNAAYQSQITADNTETFLAWNSGIDLGLDLRVGTRLSFLWGLYTKEFGPSNIPCFNYPLYRSAYDVALTSTLPDETDSNSSIEVEFKVLDIWGIPVPLCPVYISGDGAFSNQMPVTDINGAVTIQWTPDASEGQKNIVAQIFNSEKSIIDEFKSYVTVIAAASGQVPGVTTDSIFNITENSADGGGNVTDDGGAEVTARGVVWSTSQNPTIENNQGSTTDGSGTGSFVSIITDLEPNTTYYVRAYATSIAGTGYSSAMSFTTPIGSTGSTFTDPRDEKVYKTVTIGNQTWMTENLAYEPNSDNYWAYDNDNSNIETYGYLYQWETAEDVCPDGWHLPSDEEWKTLEMHLGMSQADADNTGWRGTNVGSKLAGNAGLWSNGVIENNADFGTSGFTALPGGRRYYDGTFYGIGHFGYWWSATVHWPQGPWYRTIGGFYSTVNRGNYYDEEAGFSVRCVRD